MSVPLRHVPPMHALAAFEAAARLGGFAQAAEELCVTPSAVSHRIRQLETQLGTALFERGPGGVRPTTAGRLYLDSVREAFERLAQAGAVLRPERERLRVSLPPTFARQLLMARLPEYLRAHPEVELEVHLSIPLQDVTAGGRQAASLDGALRWRAAPGLRLEVGLAHVLQPSGDVRRVGETRFAIGFHLDSATR